MLNFSPRALSFFACFLSCLSLAIALFLQIYDHLEPCRLCILQRIVYMALALLFFFGGLFQLKPITRRIFFAVTFIVGCVGVAFALRHIWLQNLLAKTAPPCGASLQYLWKVLPLTEFMRLLFVGTGDCSVINWKFLGLTMPEYSLLLYVVLAGIAGWQVLRK